jgi:hypothetical protein
VRFEDSHMVGQAPPVSTIWTNVRGHPSVCEAWQSSLAHIPDSVTVCKVRGSSHTRAYISVFVRFDEPHLYESISLYVWGSRILTYTERHSLYLWGSTILTYKKVCLCMYEVRESSPIQRDTLCICEVRRSSHIRRYVSVSVDVEDPHIYVCISLYLWGSTNLRYKRVSLCMCEGRGSSPRPEYISSNLTYKTSVSLCEFRGSSHIWVEISAFVRFDDPHTS